MENLRGSITMFMQMAFWRPLMIGLLILLGVRTSAVAGTTTDQLHVNATVVSGCSLDGGEIEFGAYTAGQQDHRDAFGEVRYLNCRGSIKIEFDGGQSGNISQRRMAAGTEHLNYQLYRDAARKNIWGSGSSGLNINLINLQSGDITIYGRVPGGQSLPEGVYTDVISITLSF